MVRVSETSGPDDVETAAIHAQEYLVCKQEVDRLTLHLKGLKDRLFDDFETVGESSDEGHKTFRLPEKFGNIVGLQKQRRVSRKLDDETARRIISEKGLEDTLLVEVTTSQVDEQAVMTALVADQLTEAEVDMMFPPKITYALTSVKR